MCNIIIVKEDIRKFWSCKLKILFLVAVYCFFFSLSFSIERRKKNWNARDRDKGDGFLLQGSTIPEGRKKRRDTCIKETCKARNEVLQVLRNDCKTINPSLSLFNVISLWSKFFPRFIHTMIKYKFDIAIKKYKY